MTRSQHSRSIRALVGSWLLLDFFGDARRAGNEHGSTLTTTIFSQSFLALVFASLLYPETPPVAFAAANLCLSTLLVAVAALGGEERPQRRAADAVMVATSPMRTGAVLIARMAHVGFHLGVVTVGMALPPAILLAHLRGDWVQGPAYVIAALCCSGLAIGSLATIGAVVARLRGAATANLLLGTIKAAALGAGFVLFALGLRALGKDADALPIGRLGAEMLPTYHAARLMAQPQSEGWRVLPWLGIAVFLVVLANLAGRTDRGGRARPISRGPLLSLLGRLAGSGPGRGIAEFVAIAMWRSPGFRARVLPLLGLPAGMVFLAIRGEESNGDFPLRCLLLQLPAIYLPFLIAFLPRADQEGTSWVFEQAPGLTMGVVRDATWRALTTHVLLPVHGLALLLLLAGGGERLATVAASLFSFAIAMLAARGMVGSLAKVPFSDSREQDGGLELGGLFAGAILLGGLGAMFGLMLPAGWRWPVAAAAAITASLALRPNTDRADATPASPTEGTQSAVAKEDVEQRPNEQRGSLGGELRAIGVLYAVLCILPWAIGALFGQ